MRVSNSRTQRFFHTACWITLVTLFLSAIIARPPAASSFKIAPLKNVHETMTLMATDCLRGASGESRLVSCSQSPAAVMNKDIIKNWGLELNDLGLGDVSVKELTKAVKWPDDPTHEVAGPTLIKFGWKMKKGCKNVNSGVQGELLCKSHYGSLQFWHAMASDESEPTLETLRKMIAWAEFLYNVAVLEVDLTQNYCGYWSEQKIHPDKVELSTALLSGGSNICAGKTQWTISTLFSLKCRRPWSSKICTETANPRDVRIRAIGALLHMVQDSFAQGHAGRGCCAVEWQTKQKTSKFECLPITQFYTYSAQDDKKHALADDPPWPGSSCTTASVDNPLLASANVLWFVKHRKGAPALKQYLQKHVFPLADDHLKEAGAGKCFGIESKQKI